MISRSGGGVRQQKGVFADQSSRAGDGVAAGLGVITENRAEFSSAGINETIFSPDRDITIEKSEVGKFGAGPKVGVFAEDGIPKVGKMPGLGIV